MRRGVAGFMDEKRGVGAFYTFATLRSGREHERRRSDDLRRDRAASRKSRSPTGNFRKRRTRRAAVSSTALQSSLNRAVSIGQYTVYYNDPNLINTRLEKVSAVTKEDVQRVANKYLVDSNRTVVVTMPKVKAKSATGASGQ
jgi:zinc protease